MHEHHSDIHFNQTLPASGKHGLKTHTSECIQMTTLGCASCFSLLTLVSKLHYPTQLTNSFYAIRPILAAGPSSDQLRVAWKVRWSSGGHFRMAVPTLMIHSENALMPSLARKFFKSLAGKKRIWMKSKGQIDFSDDPVSTEPAADKLAVHLTVTL